MANSRNPASCRSHGPRFGLCLGLRHVAFRITANADRRAGNCAHETPNRYRQPFRRLDHRSRSRAPCEPVRRRRTARDWFPRRGAELRTNIKSLATSGARTRILVPVQRRDLRAKPANRRSPILVRRECSPSKFPGTRTAQSTPSTGTRRSRNWLSSPSLPTFHRAQWWSRSHRTRNPNIVSTR